MIVFRCSIGVLSVACACSSDVAVSKHTSEIRAIVSTSKDVITVAYAQSEFEGRIGEVLDGLAPTDFYWTEVTIRGPSASAVFGTDGLMAQLQDPDSGVLFRQVYPGPCNPAIGDDTTCFLYEKYTAGEEGLSGTVQLSVSATEALGFFDVTWEGLTDRFGPPEQWHRHGTKAGYRAPVILQNGSSE